MYVISVFFEFYDIITYFCYLTIYLWLLIQYHDIEYNQSTQNIYINSKLNILNQVEDTHINNIYQYIY